MKSVPEMWGMTEVCVYIGLSRARVHQFRAADTFPEPHQILACGPIWIADDIVKWNNKRLEQKAS